MQQKVDSGLYNNASEVVREALRLFKENDEVRRAKLKRLLARQILTETEPGLFALASQQPSA